MFLLLILFSIGMFVLAHEENARHARASKANKEAIERLHRQLRGIPR